MKSASLYDGEKKKAFDAAATEGPDGTRVAAWPTIEAHAKEHDERALDPRKCMFHNLKAFQIAREQIDEIARVHIKGDVKKIPWVGKNSATSVASAASTASRPRRSTRCTRSPRWRACSSRKS